MKKLSILAIPLGLVLAVAAACGSGARQADTGTEAPPAGPGQEVETEGGSYMNVAPDELRSMVNSKDFPLVNVHIPYEGEIDGTDLFLPYDQIAQRLDELPGARDSKIVVYCRSGSMSAIAAEALVQLGYTNVWNLDGGMIAWEQSGYELITAPDGS